MSENKTLKITHLYKDLMNLYGSAGDIVTLTRCLEDMGIPYQLQEVSVGSYADIADSDFIYLGPGTERRSLLALEDIRRLKDQLQAAVDSGCILLATGTGASVFGRSIESLDGTVKEGLGFAPIETVYDQKRRYGEFIMTTDLCGEPVVGCINTSSTIKLCGEAAPLFRVEFATETGIADDTEGVMQGNLLLSQLQGPMLWRNPHLLTAIVERLCGSAPMDNQNLWYTEAVEGWKKVLSELQAAKEKRK